MTEEERKIAERKWAGKFTVLGGLTRYVDEQQANAQNFDSRHVDRERVIEERAGNIEGCNGYRPLYGRRRHP